MVASLAGELYLLILMDKYYGGSSNHGYLIKINGMLRCILSVLVVPPEPLALPTKEQP